ncbi:MAG: DUF4426 domain-containing protein [Gammaproteobacteria bacterium]|nr:DUF4426 domain-containing protein [Gammaproteobacteria bacterium]
MSKIRHRFTTMFLALLFGLTSAAAMAGGTEAFGKYQVHYNALSTTEIPPAVATGFGIVRSKNRALLNISVTRKHEGNEIPGPKPVEADVKVHASNLTGQTKDVRIRKVVEEGDYEATYYIAEINVADGETLVFDVKVTPQGSDDTFEVRFKQQFYAN